jgi:Uma2 family endonuclease
MSTVKQQLMTAEEFLHYSGPPNVKVELVRGEVVTMCRPGFSHGFSQLRAGTVLDQYGRTTRLGRAVVETGVITERDPDSVRGPDVSFWSAVQLPLDQKPEGYPQSFPDLCVEVLSPHNVFAKIMEKMGEYFRAGTRMVWIIDPEDRTVTVYRSLDQGQVFHESATLTCEDVLPGFSCPVREFFD